MPRIRKEPNRYWSKEEKLRIVKKYHGIIIYKIISWLDFIIKKLLV